MSARTVLNEAEKHGVKVTLNAAGDGLSLSAPKKPQAALLARLKEAICSRQRVAVDIENRSIRSTMIGEDVAMPVALAPTGLCGMQHADGEILVARAAEAFGVPFCLSTMSICSIEDVATNTTKPFWFQLRSIARNFKLRHCPRQALR